MKRCMNNHAKRHLETMYVFEICAMNLRMGYIYEAGDIIFAKDMWKCHQSQKDKWTVRDKWRMSIFAICILKSLTFVKLYSPYGQTIRWLFDLQYHRYFAFGYKFWNNNPSNTCISNCRMHGKMLDISIIANKPPKKNPNASVSLHYQFKIILIILQQCDLLFSASPLLLRKRWFVNSKCFVEKSCLSITYFLSVHGLIIKHTAQSNRNIRLCNLWTNENPEISLFETKLK